MGGMAEVYLGRSMGAGGVGRFVAIKRILPQFSEQTEFIDMFKSEAEIAINLQHANIASLIEFGMERNQFFIVMDFVNGRNLKQILTKLKQSNITLGIEHVVFICKEIAAGLDYAHRCLNPATARPLNVIHRDMSPHNVMISFEGEVKVVDFGIAKAETQIESTRAGTVKGKFGYMSPEQADAQEVDQRTDVFSLGIILWELLANDRLFVGKNIIEISKKIKESNIQPLRKLNPNIPAELEKITAKALARDRNQRYKTAEELHRDLHRFLSLKYPDFSKQDFAQFLKSVFTAEVEETHKKLLDYAKVNFSVPATQPPPQPDGSLSAFERNLEAKRDPSAQAPESAPFEVRGQPVRSPSSAAAVNDPHLSGRPGKGGASEGLRLDPSARGPNPFAQHTEHFGTNSVRGSTQQDAFANTQYAHRTRVTNISRVSRAQSSSGTSPAAIGIVVIALLGIGTWAYLNPKSAQSLYTKAMVAAGLIEVKTLSSTQDFGTTLRHTQDPITTLSVGSTPSGAEIRLDGVLVPEVTPATLRVREGQEVTLEISIDGYDPYKERLVITKGKQVSVSLKADKKAYIDVAVMGSGEIQINGKVVAVQGPLRRFPIPADQDVTVRAFDPVTKAVDEVKVRIEEGSTRSITLIPRAHLRGPRAPSGNP